MRQHLDKWGDKHGPQGGNAHMTEEEKSPRKIADVSGNEVFLAGDKFSQRTSTHPSLSRGGLGGNFLLSNYLPELSNDKALCTEWVSIYWCTLPHQ